MQVDQITRGFHRPLGLSNSCDYTRHVFISDVGTTHDMFISNIGLMTTHDHYHHALISAL